MPLHYLDSFLWFPPASEAMEDGLLAIGGDLSPDRLLVAYRNGIFPWFNEDEPPLWWSPDPRFVLFPSELRISKSMKQVLRSGIFEFRVNTAFPEVIQGCRDVFRPGQGGTWISDEIVAGFTELHRRGYVQCAETWLNDELVGGLYGIRMGNFFFGESMFAFHTNASKFAFINWVQYLEREGVTLIDCQVYTAHLESLGARMIPRRLFLEMIAETSHN